MATPEDAIVAYDLPLTTDGDRTFSCALGSNTFSFRTYYVPSALPGWYMDIYDTQYRTLALGRRILLGSINMLKGYANELDGVAAVVYPTEGVEESTESLGASLQIMWFPDVLENPAKDGDPMDHLLENFYIAQD